MAAYSDDDLYKSLLELGVIDKDKLIAASEQARKDHKPLEDVLLDTDLLSDENLAQTISDLIKIPFIRLREVAIAPDVLKIIPQVVAKKQQIITFAFDEQGLKLAMADPTSQTILDFVAKKTGNKVTPYFATKRDIDNALLLYREDLQKSFDELLKEKVNQAAASSSDKEAPISEIVDLLINYAFGNRASDIHIEPEKDRSLVRFRIDGILHDVLEIPRDLHDQIVSRVKVASKLKTDEHLSAQDGKMQLQLPEEELDIRVSIVPTTKGEKVVMRLLSSTSRQFALSDLGMREGDLNRVKDGFNKPYGMVLSTGPTGSGKTTTIYAIVKIINTRDVNIATIEDPVEYEIEGVNQIQVNSKTNLTFASGLRSILRQDPNAIFVGEIRDNETADIAVNSATTGHLVLSTLHTNDAATTLPRLLDMGVEPYLVASTVNVIIGQRLVRKICEKCRFSVELDLEELGKNVTPTLLKKQFGEQKQVRVYKGKGCPVCHQSGYDGRVGIFEVLVMSPEVKELITSKATSDTIREKAVALGMTTMLEDGLEKVQQGITTIDEVLRATKE
ncbi:MAG: Type II secretion system protein E (GspE) [Microgenomates group bacterium GW2011_GWA1_48_10]|uniref:AAA+ ATPase domain-containing protein n=1 Tax=Candidatus Gottesmanbacteria bacterium RIFCSPHIGHO2_01_FULL_47_48 TaxID=1798381 RepID=A0A1F6A624_9BACT|nr:MAG: Type II secretion system protein E (GspE) [Microgenomates group bacterium GW2011_GWA1_48_10]OGG19737.1 MAG: hypothetical protein A2721_01125 [Candidatus Gottesmanbacteria bacterium RIFCSPHIGHO2_01_FULL_47_48]